MKRSMKLTAALAAGGALVAGGVLAAGPVFASDGAAMAAGARSGVRSQTADGSGCTGSGAGQAGRMGGQMGGRMAGMAGQAGDRAGGGVTAASGTLSDAQRTALTAMAEEEKLAHDLYTVFADRYDAQVFDRIAAAETRHLDAVRVLLDRYGLDDPTAGRAAGAFADPATKATYDKLLAQGSTEQGALEAGRTVERTDIADLTRALDGLDAPDVQQVYNRLLDGSRMHLAAFDRWLGN